MAQTYVWRVTVYGYEFGVWQVYRDATRLFNNKVAAMNYATKKEMEKNIYGYYLTAKIEKWFGD